ncbi:hypothetical protein ACFQ07_02275 [Actinomadura adrarensis]|uniref:Uncharacterized protein n=1 Tax=Actinomadura adrarensis TaxID=1819600 RepID=A0ABW3CAS3_9ACTN
MLDDSGLPPVPNLGGVGGIGQRFSPLDRQVHLQLVICYLLSKHFGRLELHGRRASLQDPQYPVSRFVIREYIAGFGVMAAAIRS